MKSKSDPALAFAGWRKRPTAQGALYYHRVGVPPLHFPQIQTHVSSPFPSGFLSETSVIKKNLSNTISATQSQASRDKAGMRYSEELRYTTQQTRSHASSISLKGPCPHSPESAFSSNTYKDSRTLQLLS